MKKQKEQSSYKTTAIIIIILLLVVGILSYYALFQPSFFPAQVNTVDGQIIGSTEIHTYSDEVTTATTTGELLKELADENGFTYEITGSQITRIQDDANSKSMRWTVSVNGVQVSDDTNAIYSISNNDWITFKYQNYMIE